MAPWAMAWPHAWPVAPGPHGPEVLGPVGQRPPGRDGRGGHGAMTQGHPGKRPPPSLPPSPEPKMNLCLGRPHRCPPGCSRSQQRKFLACCFRAVPARWLRRGILVAGLAQRSSGVDDLHQWIPRRHWHRTVCRVRTTSRAHTTAGRPAYSTVPRRGIQSLKQCLRYRDGAGRPAQPASCVCAAGARGREQGP